MTRRMGLTESDLRGLLLVVAVRTRNEKANTPANIVESVLFDFQRAIESASKAN